MFVNAACKSLVVEQECKQCPVQPQAAVFR
jgi:hypothetical protein